MLVVNYPFNYPLKDVLFSKNWDAHFEPIWTAFLTALQIIPCISDCHVHYLLLVWMDFECSLLVIILFFKNAYILIHTD